MSHRLHCLSPPRTVYFLCLNPLHVHQLANWPQKMHPLCAHEGALLRFHVPGRCSLGYADLYFSEAKTSIRGYNKQKQQQRNLFFKIRNLQQFFLSEGYQRLNISSKFSNLTLNIQLNHKEPYVHQDESTAAGENDSDASYCSFPGFESRTSCNWKTEIPLAFVNSFPSVLVT